MKKIFLVILFLAPALARADSTTESLFNPAQLILNTTIVAIFYFTGTFILSLLKMRLDARFRDKLIDSERSDEVIAKLLQPAEKEKKDEAFRTMAILGGMAAGLTLVYATQQSGILSIAFMGVCLALSFLAYFLYLQGKSKGPVNPQ